MRDARILTTGLRFPEGPVALPGGDLLVVELAGRLTHVSPDGAHHVVAELGGSPNGAAIGPDGAVYVCNSGGYPLTELPDGRLLPVGPGGVTQDDDYIGGRIQRVDLATGEWADLYTACDGIGLRGPNDLVFDADGGFWFTDHGKRRARDEDLGGLYYALPDGSSIREVEHGLHAPNGVGLSPDGSRLYVAETHVGRLWAWEITGAGEVGAKTLVCGVPGYRLFDSLAVEAGGNVCVASIGEGGITVVTPEGDHELVAVDDERIVTNICFGGDDLRTAYVTSSGFGVLYATTWSRPGARLSF